MNKLYKSAILNLLKASNDLDAVGLGSFSTRSLKLAQTLTKRALPTFLDNQQIQYFKDAFDMVLKDWRPAVNSGEVKVKYIYDSAKDNFNKIINSLENLDNLDGLKNEQYFENLLGNAASSQLKQIVDTLDNNGKIDKELAANLFSQAQELKNYFLNKQKEYMHGGALLELPGSAPADVADSEPTKPKGDKAVSQPRRQYPPIDMVVQKWLNHELNGNIEVDGAWGPHTTGAIQQWINAHPTTNIKDPAKLVEFWTRIKDQLIKKMNAPSASEEAAATEAPDAAAKQNKAEPTLAYGKKQQLTRILNQLISQRGRVFNFQGLKQEQRDEMSGALSSMLDNLKSNNIKGMRANWFNFQDLTKNFNLGLPQFNDIQNIINAIED